MINIVVFASGSGTNFQSIIDAAEDGRISGQIRGLITNKNGIQAIERAQTHNIPQRTLSPHNFSDKSEYVETLLKQLEDWDTDLIALAGYMIKIPTEIIQQYEGRIVNIHPSLLPKYGGKGFYGMNVPLPMSQAPYAMPLLVVISVVMSLLVAWYFQRKRMF